MTLLRNWILLALLGPAVAAGGELTPREVYEAFHPAFPPGSARLARKMAAFERCLRRGELPGLIREMRRMETAIEAIEERVAADQAAYAKSGAAFFGWREAYEREQLKRHGQMPSEYPVPPALQKDFIKREIALKRTLSVKRSERAFQTWAEQRLARALKAESKPAKAIAALARGLRSKSPLLRLRSVTLLGTVRSTEAAAHWLQAASRSERHPGVLAALAALLPDKRLLMHADWPVRAGAVRGLLEAGGRDAVAALVERMPEEHGRLLDDIGDALLRLTGHDGGGDPANWARWFGGLSPEWTPPERDGGDRAVRRQVTSDGPAVFFGLRMRSRRVVFCVDGSDPGAWPAVRDPTAAAIDALGDRAVFGIVIYGRKVTRFKRQLVASNLTNRRAAKAFLEKFQPAPPRFEGNADLHAGLTAAFDLAVARGKNRPPQADTICCMTLRGPTIGLFRNPAQVAQEVVARNRLLGIRMHALGRSGGKESYYLQAITGQFGGSWAGPGG